MSVQSSHFQPHSCGRSLGGTSISLCQGACGTSIRRLTVPNRWRSTANGQRALFFNANNICKPFRGINLQIVESLSVRKPTRKHRQVDEFKSIKSQAKDEPAEHSNVAQTAGKLSVVNLNNDSFKGEARSSSQAGESSSKSQQSSISKEVASADSSPLLQTASSSSPVNHKGESFLSIAVIGATGELAKGKIFPALFALYYSGFLPQNVCIFGYSRKNLTDEDLRSIISSTITCRIDHEQNCDKQMDSFLNQTYYLNGGYDTDEGMTKLDARMKLFEGSAESNRIFYLSVPQEVLLDVAASVANYAQSKKGWNRIIIEKPFGFDAPSSQRFTGYLLSKYQENQIYRIDHLLGRNLIENLTVLRFSNLVFEPLWSRKYIRNIQAESRILLCRYFEGYGIIRDIVHSHILQTIALLAMEPPISLHGEAIRNEKVKVLRSIRKLEPSDVILGKYKATYGDEVHVNNTNLTPTYFAGALFIDNARWDGVPFMIRTGMGLIKHRVEIRIQFHQVPGNIYRERIGHNVDLATNELILRDVPDEAILIKVNNKVPGLGLQLDASELNLLYKDRYNVEVPDSYEHLLLDVIDGDSHLFMRSDELAAAWNILTPIINEVDKKNISPELYELGGRGPVGAYYLWAKHKVQWADD
ncbi:hypothetical protein SAY86_011043 [Trapa natans]|uniref:Glucose-6-phosphate 1-dehydrogenase n=1 Tax=Trapa natans TaxID=22666 RepID=A0AAN7LT77_TRANT|nr:hypothetical protein SAY86_011043 [Trapa natans]